jgi:hypothetical protein
MIKTFKVKHGMNFDPSLFEKAVKVAQYALENGLVSTAAVKHIGLKSEIANQIVRKYRCSHPNFVSRLYSGFRRKWKAYYWRNSGQWIRKKMHKVGSKTTKRT